MYALRRIIQPLSGRQMAETNGLTAAYCNFECLNDIEIVERRSSDELSRLEPRGVASAKNAGLLVRKSGQPRSKAGHPERLPAPRIRLSLDGLVSLPVAPEHPPTQPGILAAALR